MEEDVGSFPSAHPKNKKVPIKMPRTRSSTLGFIKTITFHSVKWAFRGGQDWGYYIIPPRVGEKVLWEYGEKKSKNRRG